MGRHNKSEERRTEILEHFYKVATIEGIDNTSIAKIAQSMECPPSLIMHYFRTREEMVQAFVEYMMQFSDDTADTFFSDTNIHENLFDKILDVNLKIPEVLNTKSAIFYSCYALLFRSKDVHELFKKSYEKYLRDIECNLKILMDKGVIIQQDTKILAEKFLIFSLGSSMYQNIHGNLDHHREIMESLKQDIKITLSTPGIHFPVVYVPYISLSEIHLADTYVPYISLKQNVKHAS